MTQPRRRDAEIVVRLCQVIIFLQRFFRMLARELQFVELEAGQVFAGGQPASLTW